MLSVTMEWAIGVLSARGYEVEKLETSHGNRLLFRITDVFLFADELIELAAGSYALQELESRKNAMACIQEQ